MNKFKLFLLSPIDHTMRFFVSLRVVKFRIKKRLQEKIVINRSVIAPEGWEIRNYGSYSEYYWPKNFNPPV